MRLQASITRNAPDALVAAFSSTAFVERFLTRVVGDCFRVRKSALDLAVHYVLEPTFIIPTSNAVAVQLRCTDVDRAGYTAATLFVALGALQNIGTARIREVLRNDAAAITRVHLSVVLELDEAVQASADPALYSKRLVGGPILIKR